METTDGGKAQHIDQILGAWGQFEAMRTAARRPGSRGRLPLPQRPPRPFRSARDPLSSKLLKDVKDYISSPPKQLDWQKIDINDIGSRLVAHEPATVRGPFRRELGPGPRAARGPSRQADHRHHAAPEGRRLPAHRPHGGGQHRAGSWSGSTTPSSSRSRSRTRRTTSSPMPAPASRSPGPTSSYSAGDMCRWTAGTRSASRPGRCRSRPTTTGQLQVPTAELNDPKGMVPVGHHRQHARGPPGPPGLLEHLGRRPQDPAYDQVKVYTITDRPVYRPGGPVRFKFWVARARYDQPDASDFAGKTFTVEIQNPKGEKVFTTRLHGRRVRRLRRLRSSCPPTRRWGSIRSSSRSRAAARSGSRSTRSPSSR